MRVLLLSDGYRSLDDRTRINFIKRLSELCDFKIYGPKEHTLNIDFAPVQHDKRITYSDLKGLFNPDIVLFLLYRPAAYFSVTRSICEIDVPYVILEEDHYYKDEIYSDINMFEWYKSTGFTLLLRRHFYEEESPIPSVWLPFSANEKEFKTNNNTDKECKIGFAGSYLGLEYYSIRRNAIKVLGTNDLLANPWGKIFGSEYIDYLHKYVGCLSCSGGKLHTCLAKTFEIPLSDTALLTNGIHNKKEIFGEKQCFFEYKDDCSDLVDVANTIINDVDMRDEVTANALEIVREKHTDEKRIVELYNILKAVVDGKEPPRVWGQ